MNGRFDFSKLTDEELREYMRMRRKVLIEAEEPAPQTISPSPSYKAWRDPRLSAVATSR